MAAAAASTIRGADAGPICRTSSLRSHPTCRLQEVRGTGNLADLIVAHYERHAQIWDVDRRAAPWVDLAWIDLFAGLSGAGARSRDKTQRLD